MTHEPAAAGTADPGAAARASQRQWLAGRRYLNGHRHGLTLVAADLYPASWQIAGTPLMGRPEWVPAAPLPLEAVTLSWDSRTRGPVIGGTAPAGSAGVRPLRDDGTRFGSYAAALRALDPPRLLEDRVCYRLLGVRARGEGALLEFGPGRYFSLINTSEAVAHETAGWVLARHGTGAPPAGAGPAMAELPLRSAVGDPRDLARRPVMIGVATLLLRRDRAAPAARMVLHWRDPARVAVNGGLYQVAPAGMFQPSHDSEWNLANDLSLWRSIVRELSEELLGTGEDYGSGAAPIDYRNWPLFAALEDARQAGLARAYFLGAGTDPLTMDVDLLTVLTADAPFFDETFGGLVAANDEGRLTSVEFTAASVARFTTQEAMQPAGAALLRLAWRHRRALLGG